MQKKNKLIIITACIVACGGLLFVLAKLDFPVPCLFHKLTGLRCPGCGNTRAVLSLLQLNFSEMFRYNLLFPLEAGYLLWVYFWAARNCLKTGRFSYKPLLTVLDWGFLIILLLWWVLRNFLHI